ncbi:MAG: hypothetical protein Q8S33_38060 [Myxococcales bacterium]|nr:hypothetical protein [Myxococcales bacterium]
MGWFERGVGLYSLSGTVRVVLKDEASRVGARDLAAVARSLKCPHLERLATVAPCVWRPLEARRDDARVLEIDWKTVVNSGRIADSAGSECECSLNHYRLEPMPLEDARVAVDFLSADWECDEAYRDRLVDSLTRGLEVDPQTDLELPVAFLPSIDRIIRHVSGGAFDEEGVELAALFEGHARRTSWLSLTFFRERCSLVTWENEVATRLAVQAPEWTPDEGQSPWGPARRLRLPAVLLSDGTRLPPEEKLLFAAAPDDLLESFDDSALDFGRTAP